MLNKFAHAFVAVLLFTTVLAAQDNRLSAADNAKIYFFTQSGCPPCRQVEPHIAQLSEAGYPVTTVDVRANPQWSQRFGVEGTPTVIITSGDQIAFRRSGAITANEIVKKFRAIDRTDEQAASQRAPTQRGADQNGAAQNASFTREIPVSSDGFDSLRSKADLPNWQSENGNAKASLPSWQTDPENNTSLKAQNASSGSAKANAMTATVRLKVEDPEGTSYATGTVIHSHEGESLVVTCGHVFRDSKGTGTITADFGFSGGNQNTVKGNLLFYDADHRDIALVAIHPGVHIEPVRIAPVEIAMQSGDALFSVGCDKGADPTFRKHTMKRTARYNDSLKYDVTGRPVDGRSGGGLFTAGGQLVGICNAAAVEVDEGVFAAVDNIHWQINRVKLAHLFDGTRIASSQQLDQIDQKSPADIAAQYSVNDSQLDRMADINRPTQRAIDDMGANNDRVISLAGSRANSRVDSNRTRDHGFSKANIRDVANNGHPGGGDDLEVMVIVRSKSDPSRTEAINVSNPSPEMMRAIAKARQTQSRQMADNSEQIRMPNLPNRLAPDNSDSYRAQSPR